MFESRSERDGRLVPEHEPTRLQQRNGVTSVAQWFALPADLAFALADHDETIDVVRDQRGIELARIFSKMRREARKNALVAENGIPPRGIPRPVIAQGGNIDSDRLDSAPSTVQERADTDT